MDTLIAPPSALCDKKTCSVVIGLKSRMEMLRTELHERNQAFALRDAHTARSVHKCYEERIGQLEEELRINTEKIQRVRL